jgi:hypothetical protein
MNELCFVFKKNFKILEILMLVRRNSGTTDKEEGGEGGWVCEASSEDKQC